MAAGEEDIDDTADDVGTDEGDIEEGDTPSGDWQALHDLVKMSTDRLGYQIVVVLTHLLDARVAAEQAYANFKTAIDPRAPKLLTCHLAAPSCRLCATPSRVFSRLSLRVCWRDSSRA